MSQSEKKKSKFLRHDVVVVITLLMLTLVLGGLYFWRQTLNSESQGWSQQATPVAAIQVTPRDAPVSLDAVGELTAVREVVLTAESSGRVTDISFAAGDQVKGGQRLVQLYQAEQQAELESGIALRTFAGEQLERAEELVPVGAESREVLNRRKSDYRQAQAAVKRIQAELRMKRVEAPFSGQMGLRKVDLGDYLNPGDLIASLTDLSELYVEFSLPQKALSRIETGMPVTLETDAFPGESFEARVNAIEPQVDPDTRNVRVQARLANPEQRLRPGMYVAAALNLPPQADALMLPRTAIQTSAQGNSVIVVRASNPFGKGLKGQAKVVPVTLGRRIGNEVIIREGLEPGDIVVTDGQLRIQPESEVEVIDPQGKAGGGE